MNLKVQRSTFPSTSTYVIVWNIKERWLLKQNLNIKEGFKIEDSENKLTCSHVMSYLRFSDDTDNQVWPLSAPGTRGEEEESRCNISRSGHEDCYWPLWYQIDQWEGWICYLVTLSWGRKVGKLTLCTGEWWGQHHSDQSWLERLETGGRFPWTSWAPDSASSCPRSRCSRRSRSQSGRGSQSGVGKL